MKRVVIYGCSHAFGSEMLGRGDVSNASYDLNVAKHIADALGLPLYRAAVPGGSNRFTLHQAIEHVQEGDLCLFAWTYFARDMYIAEPDTGDYDEPDHYSQHQVGNVIDEIYRNKDNLITTMQKLFNRLSINPETIQRMKSQWAELGSNKHTFLSHPNLSHIQAIARYQAEYGWQDEVSIVQFLEHYHSVNNIVKARGARAINWCMDNHHRTNKLLNSGISDWRWCKNSPWINEQRDTLGQNLFSGTKLYQDWLNDVTRVKNGDGFVTEWRKEQFGNTWGISWPGDRMGHCGPDAHEHWARILWDFALTAEIIPENAQNHGHFLNSPPKGRGGFD